ncbi:hypothetical protein FGG08_001417 [Glutinoglossum americanum]|uniref:Single-stranded DNA-binding protein n=1 Tax=Glutinoglossum americanum TaxID=1670608 RepID=A0A9P8L2Q6_9PEZI|nr:hypothetical protein FGG08_001417 [Glutinoglossum americanum]
MRAFPSSSLLLRRAFSSTPSAHYLARVTVIGRLAADPEAHITSTGKELVKYAVGTSSGSPENRKTSWFRFVSFDEGPRKDFLLGLRKGYGGESGD